MPDAVAKTLGQDILQERYWRNIRGQITPVETSTWQGLNYARHIGNSWLVDDGQVQTQYFSTAKKVFLDDPRTGYRPRPSLKFLLDTRWKWVKAEAKYKGQDAILHTGTGTFRDSGKDQTIETKVYVERTGSRILYIETWGGNHTYADFYEYSYPAVDPKLFKVEAPQGTPILDLRPLRLEIAKRAKGIKSGLVCAIQDLSGQFAVVAKGGAMPDDTRPGKVYVNGKLTGAPTTMVYGLQKSIFTALGKDVWLHTSHGDGGLNLPERGTVSVHASTRVNGKTVPLKPLQFGTVTIHTVPNVVIFLRPLMRQVR